MKRSLHRSSLVFVLPVALAACSAESAAPDDVGQGEDDLSVRKLRSDRVELLAGHQGTALFVATMPAGRELRAGATSASKLLATLGAGELVSASGTADPGMFLLRRAAGLALVDLRGPTPTLVDVVANVSVVEAVASKGHVAYTKRDGGWDRSISLRDAAGQTRAIPAKDARSLRFSDDGKVLAFVDVPAYGNIELVRYEVATGTTTRARIDSTDQYAFLGSRLLGRSPRASELVELTGTGATRFWFSGLAQPDMIWRRRPDGRLLAGVFFEGSTNELFTSVWAIDPNAGAGEFIGDDPTAPRGRSPHFLGGSSALSADGRWLLDWYHTSTSSNVGELWLHDVGGARTTSRKLLDRLPLGRMTSSGLWQLRNGELRGHCSFELPFVRCTQDDAQRTDMLLVAVAQPDKALPWAPPSLDVTPDASARCWTTPAEIVCRSSSGAETRAPVANARHLVPNGGSFFGSRFLFVAPAAAASSRVATFDPATGATSDLLTTACAPGDVSAVVTPTRVLVADCTGLRAIRP
jgi:hypothetical protein